mmetsp:Transcript_18747/g.44504  ORF Transcript_18747/g.44504 Transcript_18747/m.44504 type:complete len:254 (-) Transcript_18747:2245-3006(-)
MSRVRATTALKSSLLLRRSSISRRTKPIIAAKWLPCSDGPSIIFSAGIFGGSRRKGIVRSLSVFFSASARASSSPASMATQRMKKSGGLSSRGHSMPKELKCCSAALGGPKYTERPSTMISTLSNKLKTSSLGWWIVASTVFLVVFSPRAKSCKSFVTLYAIAESSPLVASSAKSSVGSVRSSVAKARRRRSPPEMPEPMEPIKVFWHLLRPSSNNNASARFPRSALDMRPMRKPLWKSRCSRTVSPAKSCSS